MSETISKERFAKDVGCPLDKIDEVLLDLVEKRYLRVFEYDKEGNPIRFNLNADNKKEAKALLKKFDEYEF